MIENLVSPNFVKISLATVLYGTFKGFYDAVGVPVTNYALIVPPAIQSVMGLFDGISIAKRGQQITGNYPLVVENNLRDSFEFEKEGIGKTIYSGYMGFVGEGLASVVEMGIGYGLGYLFGMRIKNSK